MAQPGVGIYSLFITNKAGGLIYYKVSKQKEGAHITPARLIEPS